ncbi:MAG: hypothetical protein GY950_34125 [bacterium]|nr:hypothetical protein [bacterium]
MNKERNLISQDEINDMLTINGFISGKAEDKSLIEEIKDALLDSGRLSLREWRSLRARLKEIEKLIPHIDLIIELKEKRKFLEKVD